MNFVKYPHRQMDSFSCMICVCVHTRTHTHTHESTLNFCRGRSSLQHVAKAKPSIAARSTFRNFLPKWIMLEKYWDFSTVVFTWVLIIMKNWEHKCFKMVCWLNKLPESRVRLVGHVVELAMTGSNLKNNAYYAWAHLLKNSFSVSKSVFIVIDAEQQVNSSSPWQQQCRSTCFVLQIWDRQLEMALQQKESKKIQPRNHGQCQELWMGSPTCEVLQGGVSQQSSRGWRFSQCLGVQR